MPKDGPSAGVTMATALASLLTGRPVRADVGMTGEITLRGQVLPIGGVKEKMLAAHRAGLKTVILPQRNEKDLDDVPEEVRKQMHFILADRWKMCWRRRWRKPARTAAARLPSPAGRRAVQRDHNGRQGRKTSVQR